MNTAPEFRRLERATDSSEMRAFFTEHLTRLDRRAEGLVHCHIPRVFPRGEDSFVVQYELGLSGPDGLSTHRQILCGVVYTAPDDARRASVDGYDGEHCLRLPDLGLWVPLFPYDPGLPILTDLWDATRAHSLLALLTGRGPDRQSSFDVTARRLLGYRLERRCTMRFACAGLNERGSARSDFELVVKSVRPKKVAGILRTVAKLESAGLSGEGPDGLTIPALLGADSARGVIVMELAPGASLHELVGQPDLLPGCAAAGRLLRRLHDLPGPGEAGGAKAATEALGELDVWSRRLCTIFPRCTSDIGNAYLLLEAHRLPDLQPAEVRLVHRDFYDKQVLYTTGRTTLLDFDNMSPGDPAQDVGNFLAHLELRGLQDPERVPAIDAARTAFMEAYGRDDGGFIRRVRWWQAGTFLRLACVYALRPRWRRLTRDLTERCRHHLNSGRTAPGEVRS